MTRNPKDAREALRRLADSLAEDILNAPDQEILEGAKEIYGSPEKLAAEMLKLFEQTANEQGKARLAAARAAVAADRRQPSKSARMDAAEARRRFQRIITTDPDATRTLAARKGEEPSDDDVRSAIEDFEELGVLPPDPKDSKK
jgi:hypothetical protein